MYAATVFIRKKALPEAPLRLAGKLTVRMSREEGKWTPRGGSLKQ
jgi:hypothetical protein